MKTVLYLLCCLFPFASLAQIHKIQWATQVDYQYNQYQEGEFSAQQALGIPDAVPAGHLNRRAFRLNKSDAFGTLRLSMDPAPVTHLIIIENNDPGRISRINLIDTEGLKHTILRQRAYHASEDFRTLVLTIPKTDFLVQAIELNIDATSVTGNPQIDAVGILSEGSLSEIEDILSGANFNVQQVMSFVDEKELLSASINSRYIEAKPLVSHDGNTLYFSRLFHPDNVGGRTDPQDIYVSTLTQNQWSQAQNVREPLNDDFANGVCSISPDGKKLLLINGYESDGSISPGVSISRRTSKGWSEPSKIDIHDFSNLSEFQDFYMSADERVIIMAVEHPNGVGDQDLYASLKIGNQRYSRPIHLGRNVNTRKAEFAPFLSPDNTTLYFASEGHKGFGESDIYRTKRLDDTWRNWSQPQNIGPAVNTSSWEGYFSITASNDYAYFVSSEDATRKQHNIYRIPLMANPFSDTELPQIAFQGRVFDAYTNEPIQSTIIVSNTATSRELTTNSDGLTGNFLMYLPQITPHSIRVTAPGYEDYIEQVDDANQAVIHRNVFLRPVEQQKVFTLKDLMFERSKAILMEDSEQALHKLLSLLQRNPEINIELAGHTDGLGSRSAKTQLSYRRVERIKDYLVQSGIHHKRIEVIGYGGSQPIAPNNTEENRAKNRRVEVRIQ